MQVLGQLEGCDLDECDFFQVKIEEYKDYEDYCNDYFEIDGSIISGRTKLNYPKGVTIYGRWTAFKPSAAGVICYFGK